MALSVRKDIMSVQVPRISLSAGGLMYMRPRSGISPDSSKVVISPCCTRLYVQVPRFG